MLPAGASAWSDGLVLLALCNVVLIGFVVMAQTDLRQMIGYGSVMHMGYCFLGLATLSVIGVGGAVMLMVAHGLSVALLFLLSTYVQKRTILMDMEQLGGLAARTPVLAACFVAATMAAIGLPGFGNFLGEFSIFNAMWIHSKWLVALAATGILISAIYGLRAVSRIFFGQASNRLQEHWEKEPPKDLSLWERVPIFLLLGFMLLIGMKPLVISDGINDHVKSLNYEDHKPGSEDLQAASEAPPKEVKDSHHH